MTLTEDIDGMHTDVAATRGRILVVDDEALFGKAVVRRLERAGYACEHAQDLASAAAMQKSIEPDLVLLDEPAAGLTGEEVERMIAVIHELNREAALVVVEHDMHFVRSIAETVTVFHQGRVLTEAPVEAVMADPQVRDVYLGKRA